MATDELLIARLRTAMDDEVRGHQLDRTAARAIAAKPQRSRHAYLAIAASVVVAAGIAIAYVSTNGGSHSGQPAASGSCSVAYSVLPAWARTGFSDPRPVMPNVLASDGKIIAILWSRTDPLNAPPLRDRNNKILWVSPRFGAPLVIRARLGDTTVVRTVPGGPGPSIIDLPRAGCWTFDLSWGDNHDTLRLPYAGR